MPSATAPRMPAWQRLGLKLKSATEQPSIAAPVPPQAVESPKRKRSDEVSLPPKKIKTSTSEVSITEPPNTPHQLLRKKSVSFTPETKVDDGDSIKQLFKNWEAEQKAQDPTFDFKSSSKAFETPEPVKVVEEVDTALSEKERRVKRVQKLEATPKSPNEKPKVKKAKTKAKAKSPKVAKIVQPAKPTSRPFLDYLKQYHEDRVNWKFSKNHQNHLLKNVFDVEVIPSDYAHLIYYYIRGLQGAVRTRLRDTAIQIKVKDIEDGAAAFGEKMALDMRAQKQREYEEACQAYVDQMTVLNASTKMGYEEGKLAGLSDQLMKGRVAKRMRAEMILQNLATGDGGEFGDRTTDEVVKEDDDSQKRSQINDGTAKKVGRKRKQRTVVDEDTSSSGESCDSDSESESESGSDSSSGSEAGLAPGVAARLAQQTRDEADTSSSSSSSSEEEESDSEEESSDGSEEEV